MLRWLAIAGLVAACGHAPPAGTETGAAHATPPPAAPADAAAPKGLDEDLPRLAAKTTELYQQLAVVLGDKASDCAAVTTKLDAVATTYADVIAANAKVLHAGHERIQQLKAAIEPHEDALDAAAKTIGESQTMKACAEDPGFAKAIDRLLGEP